jgi:hypothetical protein
MRTEEEILERIKILKEEAEIYKNDCKPTIFGNIESKITMLEWVLKDIELKPCPFCHGPAKLIIRDEIYHDIGCETEECWLENGSNLYWKNKEEAANIWNNRKE